MNRAVAAFVGFAFVLGSLFGFAHEAATVHVRCAEHGELIHGEVASPTAVLASHDVLAQGGQPAEARGHEHCDIASAMRESRVAPHVPAIVAETTCIDIHAAAPSAVDVVLGTRLYLRAPKTSPPTHA